VSDLVDKGLIRALHRAMRKTGDVDAGCERMTEILMASRSMSREVADHAVREAALWLLDHTYDDNDESEDE
jgi:hypothetical protein